MGDFYKKLTLVNPNEGKGKVNEVEVVDVPVVVSSVAVAGSPSLNCPLPVAVAGEQPNLPSDGSKVNVKDALGSKMSILGTMFGGQQITLDRNIHDLNTVDDSLGMKTEVREPAVFSVWELVGELALSRGYSRTADIFGRYSKLSKINMVSFERKGRRELKEIYSARQGVEDNSVGEDDSAKDRLLGKRSR